VYQLENGIELKDGDFDGEPRPLIVASESDLECPSIVFSLTRTDDKSNYGFIKYATNAAFGVPNQVRLFLLLLLCHAVSFSLFSLCLLVKSPALAPRMLLLPNL